MLRHKSKRRSERKTRLGGRIRDEQKEQNREINLRKNENA